MYEDSLHCYLRTFTRDQTWDQGHLRQEMVFVLSVTNGCCGWWNNIFLILTAIKIKWTQSNHNKIINDIIKSWRFEYSLQQILFFQLHYIAHTQYPSNIEVKVSMDLPGWSPSTSGHQNIQHEHWQASKVSRAAEDTLCDSRHQLTMTMKRTEAADTGICDTHTRVRRKWEVRGYFASFEFNWCNDRSPDTRPRPTLHTDTGHRRPQRPDSHLRWQWRL